MQTVNSLLFKFNGPKLPSDTDTGAIGIRVTWTVYGRGLLGAPQAPITAIQEDMEEIEDEDDKLSSLGEQMRKTAMEIERMSMRKK